MGIAYWVSAPQMCSTSCEHALRICQWIDKPLRRLDYNTEERHYWSVLSGPCRAVVCRLVHPMIPSTGITGITHSYFQFSYCWHRFQQVWWQTTLKANWHTTERHRNRTIGPVAKRTITTLDRQYWYCLWNNFGTTAVRGDNHQNGMGEVNYCSLPEAGQKS